MDYLSRALELEKQIDAMRRDFHMHPELGNREFRTSDRIVQILEGLGLEVRRVYGTAVLALLRGSSDGPTVAIRSDIDALPVTEETGCDFASRNPGIMHACGHDVHITSALSCAMLLASNRDALEGNVLFVFEPDEEGEGNAAKLIEHGAMDGVAAVFGGHVDPSLPLGTIGVKYGKMYAASDVITVNVHGLSCHGATPEKGHDALMAASEMVLRLSRLECPCPEPYVFSIGQLSAGTASNVIADQATFAGVLRTFGNESLSMLRSLVRSTVAEISEKYSVTSEIVISGSYGGVVNTDRETDLAREQAVSMFGEDHVVTMKDFNLTTEDFGYYIDSCCGAFVSIGAGDSSPLHSPVFLPSSKAAVYAGALYASIAEKALKTYRAH